LQDGVADVVRLQAVPIVDGNRCRPAARRPRKHRIRRLIGGEADGDVARRTTVNRQMQARVARPRRGVSDGGDQPIGQGAHRNHREVRRRLTDVEHFDLRALGDGGAVTRVPAALLQIRDDDDSARPARQRLNGGGQRGAIACRTKTDGRAIDRRRGQHAICSGLRGDLCFIGERDNAHVVGRRRLGDRVLRQLPGPFEPARCRQAERRVERDDGRAARRQRRAGLKERACKGKCQQDQRGDPQREEQQLAKVPALRIFHWRVLQELDRGKLHPRLGLALEQVQNQRNSSGERTSEKHGGQKRHQLAPSPEPQAPSPKPRHFHRALDLVERYDMSASSSGWFVFSSW
jgi:hypothetical protein